MPIAAMLAKATLALFLLAAAGGVEAHLRKPASKPVGEAHGLNAYGSGVTQGANPEIDAWHAEEKAKIEEDCDEALRKAREEKRRKLVAIVNEKEKIVADTGAELKEASSRAGEEAAELAQEKLEYDKEAAKVPKVGGFGISDLLAKIEALKKLIAEKQACIEELKLAEQALLDAKAKLADLKGRLAALERKRADAKAANDAADKEMADLEAEISTADDELTSCRARLDAAKAALAKAEADLKEHDDVYHKNGTKK